MQRFLINLKRFKKIRYLLPALGHIAFLLIKEFVLDTIIDFIQGEVWVDKFVLIVVIASFIGFVLWVLLRKDREADAQQLYLILQDIKRGEKDVVRESVIPRLKMDITRFTFDINIERWLRKPRDAKSSEADIGERTRMQIVNLVTGEVLENTLQTERHLRRYRNRLDILKATFMDSDLDGLLNEFSQKRLDYLKVDTTFKVLRDSWKLDREMTTGFVSVLQQSADEMRKIEKNVVKRLNSLIKESIKEKEYEPSTESM